MIFSASLEIFLEKTYSATFLAAAVEEAVAAEADGQPGSVAAICG